jgi:hypothetical protein
MPKLGRINEGALTLTGLHLYPRERELLKTLARADDRTLSATVRQLIVQEATRRAIPVGQGAADDAHEAE